VVFAENTSSTRTAPSLVFAACSVLFWSRRRQQLRHRQTRKTQNERAKGARVGERVWVTVSPCLSLSASRSLARSPRVGVGRALAKLSIQRPGWRVGGRTSRNGMHCQWSKRAGRLASMDQAETKESKSGTDRRHRHEQPTQTGHPKGTRKKQTTAAITARTATGQPLSQYRTANCIGIGYSTGRPVGDAVLYSSSSRKSKTSSESGQSPDPIFRFRLPLCLLCFFAPAFWVCLLCLSRCGFWCR
jgi:hypothetical protein